MKFEMVEDKGPALLKVIGVGGGGGNAVQTMIRAGLTGVEFIVTNTDSQALARSDAPVKLQLGAGLGAGARPDKGREAALESRQAIAEELKGAEMVFITAGMGGGTGTGASPIIAEVAREQGALTVAVVTKPFAFEGRRRMKAAEEGIAELRNAVDTLITIPNQKLLAIADENTSLLDAFKTADEVLLHAVQSISDLITVPGIINLDFADVKTTMDSKGLALMGTGVASGEDRAQRAAEMAVSSPLLENVSVKGATAVLLNITGGTSMKLGEIDAAASYISEAASEDANIIFGAVIDEKLEDAIRITVIATGFEGAGERAVPVRDAGSPPIIGSQVQPGGSGYLADNYNKYRDLRTVKRAEQEVQAKREQAMRGGSVGRQAGGRTDEDEYDIPTFLRRTAD